MRYVRLRKPATLEHPVTGVPLAPSPRELFPADDPLVVAYPQHFVPARRKDTPNGTG